MAKETLKIVAAAALLAASSWAALGQAQNPACQRLETQLASLDRGTADPARAEQIRRHEEGANKQQFELDRLVAQSRRLGCESFGFFSIFNSPPAQCPQIISQIQQMRGNLDRLLSDLQHLQGNTDRAAQRASLLLALGDNNCGPQYRTAAATQGNFFERLFSGGSVFTPDSQSGSFRTICVRSCDGYYFPISFATAPAHFGDDEQTCRRMCPASEVSLYTYRNPGEEVAQAVSLSGQPYTGLPTAFRYRQEYNAACSCRRPGQSWADAMKTSGDATIEQGDIVVSEDRAKRLSLPPAGKPVKQDPRVGKTDAPPAAADPAITQSIAPPAEPDGKRSVRTVGQPFLPAR